MNAMEKIDFYIMKVMDDLHGGNVLAQTEDNSVKFHFYSQPITISCIMTVGSPLVSYLAALNSHKSINPTVS